MDWGGNSFTERRGGVIGHTYPDGVFQNYAISVLVQDGRGAFADARLDVTFDPPADNAAPVIEGTTLVNQDGFLVVVHVRAQDPDGDALTYTFDWGDEGDVTRQINALAAHVYPSEFGVRQLVITVSDERGGLADVVVPITFDPPPDNANPVVRFTEVIDREGGALLWPSMLRILMEMHSRIHLIGEMAVL